MESSPSIMALNVGSVTPRYFQAITTLSLSAIPANSYSRETVTVAGLQVDMVVHVTIPSLNAGLFLLPCFVSAANTLAINIVNATAASITPTALTEIRVVAL